MRTAIKKYSYIICIVAFAFIVVISGLVIFRHSRGSVVINEICSSNVSCCEDENGNYPDWIELYNPTQDVIDLSGFVINKSTDLKKEIFTFPEGMVLGAGEFYLFDPKFTIGSKGGTINLLDDRRHYIDRVTFPHLKYDTTYARTVDGENDWTIMTPTPGYSNTDGKKTDPVLEGKVNASVEPGFYDEEFDLKLRSSDWGRDIYYTTDGSDPRTDGILYEGVIHITDRSNDPNIYSQIREVSLRYVEGNSAPPSFPVDKCTTVRAVAKDDLGRFTDIYTFSYFVGYKNRSAYDNVAVLSIVANPDDLFSNENGIYVLGRLYDEYVAAGLPQEYDKRRANFTVRGRDSERAASIEIFDESHNLTLKCDGAIKIKGASSRADEQKGMAVMFRQAYGGDYRESFTLSGKDYKLHSFALDKCGQDWGTMMRDTLMGIIMKDTRCAVADRIPACLFLNGEYWGFYWLSERYDNAFFADKYGVDKDDVIIKDKDDFTSADEWSEDNFDRESIIDYYAANIVVEHGNDWPGNNVRFWMTGRDEGTEYGDGKLRPIIFDMNSHSMFDPKEVVFDRLMELYYPFIKLTYEDENFRKDICDRIDELCGNEISQDRMLELIDEIHDRIRPQMILNYRRFFDFSEKEASEMFEAEVEEIRDFYRYRYDYLETYKEEYLNGD